MIAVLVQGAGSRRSGTRRRARLVRLETVRRRRRPDAVPDGDAGQVRRGSVRGPSPFAAACVRPAASSSILGGERPRLSVGPAERSCCWAGPRPDRRDEASRVPCPHRYPQVVGHGRCPCGQQSRHPGSLSLKVQTASSLAVFDVNRSVSARTPNQRERRRVTVPRSTAAGNGQLALDLAGSPTARPPSLSRLSLTRDQRTARTVAYGPGCRRPVPHVQALTDRATFSGADRVRIGSRSVTGSPGACRTWPPEPDTCQMEPMGRESKRTYQPNNRRRAKCTASDCGCAPAPGAPSCPRRRKGRRAADGLRPRCAAAARTVRRVHDFRRTRSTDFGRTARRDPAPASGARGPSSCSTTPATTTDAPAGPRSVSWSARRWATAVVRNRVKRRLRHLWAAG